MEGTLAEEFVFTGEVSLSSQTSLTLLPIPGAAISVVTGRPVDPGATLLSGNVLTEVNGRPVFIAQSPFSFYRDIGPGDHGPDVSSLQSVLAGQGYDVVVDGEFGDGTERAVARWYADNGYSVPTRSRGDAGSSANASTFSEAVATPAAPEAPPLEDAYVPVTEIVAMPMDSAYAIQGVGVDTRVAQSGTADLVIGGGEAIVTVSAAVGELQGLAPGDAATISVAGTEVEGTLGVISASQEQASGEASQDGAAEQGDNHAGVVGTSSNASFVVTPTTPLPPTEGDGQARVTVTKAVVAEDALLVPILAITDRGGGTTVVARRETDGTLTEVRVTVLATLDGQVAVEPTTAGALEPGDEVRVG